jgi:hypothetical protein
LNVLAEAYQFYPLIIKRDKNLSASIYQVLNGNQSSGKSEEIARDIAKVHMQNMLEMVWAKIH